MGQEKEKKQELSRREALKALVAAGGAVTLSSLPTKWEKPAIEVGILPVHAQTSPVVEPTTLNISNLASSASQGACDPGGGQTGTLFLLTLDYEDTSGGVLPNETRLRVEFSFPSGGADTDEITLSAINLTGDGVSGTISVPICIGFGNNSSVSLNISITNNAGSTSNGVGLTISASTTSLSEQKEGESRGRIIISR